MLGDQADGKLRLAWYRLLTHEDLKCAFCCHMDSGCQKVIKATISVLISPVLVITFIVSALDEKVYCNKKALREHIKEFHMQGVIYYAKKGKILDHHLRMQERPSGGC